MERSGIIERGRDCGCEEAIKRGFVTRQETAEDREAVRHAATEILCHGRGSDCSW